jgi:hypothetical protein
MRTLINHELGLDPQDECVWEEKDDFRKQASRQQLDGLRSRIQDLERMLRAKGVDHSQIPTDMQSFREEAVIDSTDEEENGRDSHGEWAQNHLVSPGVSRMAFSRTQVPTVGLCSLRRSRETTETSKSMAQQAHSII